MSRPSRILLIGSGRLARHLQFYLRSLDHLELLTWSRRQNNVAQLHALLPGVDMVALAIADSALADFTTMHQSLNPHIPWIHFSGASLVPGVTSYHPLMTFGQDFYDLEFYRHIPFVTEAEASWPAALKLTNSLHHLPAEQKALYHSLCVLSGNFTTLLWLKAQAEFRKLGLPPEILRSYAERGLRNVFEDPTRALTGPLVRRDQGTQTKNLQALGADPFADVYRAFQKAYEQDALFQVTPTPPSGKGSPL